MELKTSNILLVVLSLSSFIWSVISPEFRTPAMMIGFVMLVLLILSEQNTKLEILSAEYSRLNEKLKIHEQLIDIKADIKELKRKNKNG